MHKSKFVCDIFTTAKQAYRMKHGANMFWLLVYHANISLYNKNNNIKGIEIKCVIPEIFLNINKQEGYNHT